MDTHADVFINLIISAPPLNERQPNRGEKHRDGGDEGAREMPQDRKNIVFKPRHRRSVELP